VRTALLSIESKSVKGKQCVVQKDVNPISLSLRNPTQELIHSVPRNFAEVSFKNPRTLFPPHYTVSRQLHKKELKP